MDEQIKGIVNAIGSIAELAWTFYRSMINAGASEQVALVGMQSFIESLMGSIVEQAMGGEKE